MIAWVPTIASTFHLGRGPRANPRGNLWSSKGRGLQWRWKTTGPVSQEKNQESAGQKGGESLKEEDERLSFRWGPLCSLGAWFAICFFRNILLKDVSHRNVQHFSSPQQLHVASGYYPGQHRYRLCPSLQKVLGDGAGLDHGWVMGESGESHGEPGLAPGEAVRAKALQTSGNKSVPVPYPEILLLLQFQALSWVVRESPLDSFICLVCSEINIPTALGNLKNIKHKNGCKSSGCL